MIQHDEYENKSSYYDDTTDELIATLDFGSDTFTDESEEGLTKQQADEIYFEMYQHREDIYNIVIDDEQFSYEDFR